MSLASYADKFSGLNVARVGGHERPHKPVMLLALLDLFEQAVIKENKITYSPELLELFGEYFDAVRSENDQSTPINPYFYLRSDGFWHHHACPGKDSIVGALSSPPGIKASKNSRTMYFLTMNSSPFFVIPAPGHNFVRG
jgi:predicted restriction endonuclease